MAGRKLTAACTACEVHAESTFRVEGMDCREEVALIERRFTSLHGIEHFSADVVGRKLHVAYDAAKLSSSSIVAAVADAGMRASLEHEEPIAESSEQRRQTRALVSAAALLAAAVLLEWFQGPPWSVIAASAAAIVLAVPATARKARRALRVRVLDINVLMLVAAAGAVLLGQWTEAASVVVLFAVAELLEARTLDRARRAVSALLSLAPSNVLLRDHAGERVVPADSVPVGSVIVVKPGEKLALDGVVIAGESAVNQAQVTGESLPIDKRAGEPVYAGSINGDGVLEVQVTSGVRDTSLARIIHLVERAQAQRAPAQTFVERFARIYTPTVLGIAVAIAVVPPVLFGGAWPVWIYRALVLLVVSCPCALVISTPVSVVAALSSAARKGVLIKGGVYLERLASIRTVAFDKTGTVTTGHPDVAEVVPFDGTAADVLALAAAVERHASHPIAGAIIRHAAHLGLPLESAASVRSLTGLGAEGEVDGRRILVGSRRLFEARQIPIPAAVDVHERLEDSGTVLVARDGECIGVIRVADRVRPEAAGAIALMRRQGIQRVTMLTGDRREVALAMARSVGVDDVNAELSPEQKADAVESLKRTGDVVAMVGDGINDAPALAAADVGIAMGAIGSAPAIESADIALMSDELAKIPYALRLGRTTMRNIKANLALSLFLKAAFVVAAVAGVATLWMAIAADAGATVLVVANALRLLRAD